MHNFKVKIASNFWENSIGLLGTRKPFPILLRTHFGIHTFGMKYPIDVLILDSQNRVKFIKQNLEPWRVYFWNFLEDRVLELPVGTIKEKKIRLYDQIKF